MNKIRVLFAPGERMIVAPAEFKRNTGQILEVYGVPFDEGAVLRVAFISDGDDEAVPATGTVENGALSIPIPDDKFFDLDEDGGDEGRIRAYFAVVDDDSITTEYCVVIPLIDAPPLSDPYEDATPAQRSAIDEIIRQMTTTAEAAETAKQKAETAADKSETNVTKYPKIVGGNWYVWDADAGDFVDTGIKAVGEKGETGATGEKGDKGDKGDPGEKGETGATGAKGDKGDTGATGAKGDKGDPGEKGDPGIPGEKGDTGEKGDKGDKGDKGEPGEKGETGATGAKGEPGEKGDKGDKGDTGADGFSPVAKVTQTTTGATISITDKTGMTTATVSNGATGEKGDKGDKGDTGEKGDTGADGYSPVAKVESVSNGAKITVTDKTGTTSVTVTNGEKGDTGATGEKGDKGDTGSSGVYVGSEEPTDENVTVWVDTDGTADEETAEVIIDTTTDEDSAAIVIDRDANGEAFRLKAAKIICLLPASLTEALDYITAKYKAIRVDGVAETLSFPTLRYPIKTKCALTYEFDGRGGLGFVRGSSASGIGSSSSQHLVMTASWGLNRYISEFQLRQYSASTTLIPAGTRIMIIGIRG